MYENIIKISLDTFLTQYEARKTQEIPKNVLEKADNLKHTFNCFNSYYDPKMIWEKKKFTKKEDKPTKNRFHIIIPDFSDDGVYKREIISHLNKLTIKNKDTIYHKLFNIIKNNYENIEHFNIIWSYIKSTDSDLYLDVLKFYKPDFFNENLDGLWYKYIKEKQWMPPKYIFDNDLLHSNVEYAMYCDYIKWKKETHNTHIVWIKMKKNIDLLLNDIYTFLIQYINKETDYTVHKYIIDIFLEQIDRILKYYKNLDIIENFKNMDLSTFESSSKFLIYSIIEKK
jgi:hypothetical protein